jgi:hypothetical protein
MDNFAEKHSINLQESLERIKSTKVGFFEAELPELSYAGGNRVKFGTDTYELSPQPWQALCKYLEIPEHLLPRLGSGLGGLVFKCLKENGLIAPNASKQIRVAYNTEGRVVSITPANLVYITNNEIISIINQASPPNIISQTLSAKLLLTETEFELTCYTHQLSTEPSVGDTLYGGISIRHSQTGEAPTVILGYIHRLVCTNGMTQRVCLGGKPARTKRCKAKNSKEPVLEALREQIKHAWAQLEKRLEGIKELTKHKFDVDQLPEGLRRKWSINREIAAEIARAFENDELDRTYTEYDLVNALSRVATHSRRLAPRYQRHLSLAAGMFAQRHIHQCPMCGSWSDAAFPTQK